MGAVSSMGKRRFLSHSDMLYSWLCVEVHFCFWVEEMMGVCWGVERDDMTR